MQKNYCKLECMSPTTVHKYICVCMCVYTVYMTDNKVLQKKFILLIMHILSSFDILFFYTIPIWFSVIFPSALTITIIFQILCSFQAAKGSPCKIAVRLYENIQKGFWFLRKYFQKIWS